MSGINNSTIYMIGRPSDIKPTQHALCSVCGEECYRQTFANKEEGWLWRHTRCNPTRPIGLERRRSRSGASMGYVPKSYPLERNSSFDPALAQAIKAQR